MSTIRFIGITDPINKIPFELVERKGIGHPDTLADGATEAASIAYAQFCMKNFGGVLHNYLSAYIHGGRVDVKFGSSSVTEPARLFLGGQLSTTFDNKDFGATRILVDAAETYIRSVLPLMEERDLVTDIVASDFERSPHWRHPLSLSDVPEIHDPRSNDTSTAVGSWPISIAENIALQLEGFFYNEGGGARFRDVGHDIKVMVRRIGNSYDITLAVPLLARYITDYTTYNDRLVLLGRLLTEYASNLIHNRGSITLKVNAERMHPTARPGQLYMQHYGSCIESAEEGFVGRGNKGFGVISPMRPMSMEAPHGKNPLSNNGKVHALMAMELAKKLSEMHDGAAVNAFINTSIGEHIKHPSHIAVEASTEISLKSIRKAMDEVRQFDYLTMLLDGYFMPKIYPYNQQVIINHKTGSPAVHEVLYN